MQRLHAVFPGEFKVRDGPYHVGSQPQRLFQQGFAVGIRHDALLREGDDLQRNPGGHFLLHFQHRT
ncbi:hypothetical protein D3C71_1951890 [compost metagenome]